MNNLFPYRWNLSQGHPATGIEPHNKKVFSTFACGGGSSMGYKLAGYNVIAANDIDKTMEKVYIANHHPNYFFKCDVKDLLNLDYPDEFYHLDILDGSPPCSTFSMAGLREKAWGKDKMFREGQAMQVLDDLFFDWIKLVKKLQPKVAIAENVKGMLQGNAKGYLVEIKRQLEDAGYTTQLFLLNAATMGVPQRRERVFFIATKKEFNLPKINLDFSFPPIPFRAVYTQGINDRQLQPKEMILWKNKQPGERSLVPANKRLFNKDGYFKSSLIGMWDICNTIIAGDALVLQDEPRHLNNKELSLISTFPEDYNFLDIDPAYLMGMSVPPVMMAQVAYQVYKQVLDVV